MCPALRQAGIFANDYVRVPNRLREYAPRLAATRGTADTTLQRALAGADCVVRTALAEAMREQGMDPEAVRLAAVAPIRGADDAWKAELTPRVHDTAPAWKHARRALENLRRAAACKEPNDRDRHAAPVEQGDAAAAARARRGRATPCGAAGGRRHERRGATGEAGYRRRVARAEPGVGRSGVRLPAVLAGGGGAPAESGGRDGAGAGAAAGVGALRRVRTGGRVLRRGTEEGVPEATVRTGAAPRDGDQWRDGEAAAR